MIGVDEVEADGGVAHARLARPRLAHRDVLVSKHFGAAGLVDAHRLGHVTLLPIGIFLASANSLAKGARARNGPVAAIRAAPFLPRFSGMVSPCADATT